MQIVPSFATRYARNITEARFPSLWRGLVGLWMPSVGVQGSKLIDFSNTQNHAVIHSSSLAPWPHHSGNKGRRGTLASSTNNYWEIATPRRAGITGDISIMGWIKRTGALPNRDAILTKSDGATWDYLLYFRADNNFLSVFSSASGGVLLASLTAVTDDKWHHCAFTRIGSACSIYLDGKVDNTGPDGTLFGNNTIPVLLGRSSASSEGVDGLLDDIRLYNRGLSRSEIAASAAGWSPLSLREDLRVGALLSLGNIYQMFI